MEKKLLIFGIIVMLVIILSGCTQSNIGFSETHEVKSGTVIDVHNNIGGEISIFGNYREEFINMSGLKESMEPSISLDDLEKILINVNMLDNHTVIETIYDGDMDDVYMARWGIHVPTKNTIGEVLTSNGEIYIEKTKGNITATTSNGDITLLDIIGNITATISYGDFYQNDNYYDGDHLKFQDLTGTLIASVPANHMRKEIDGFFTKTPSENTTIICNYDTIISISSNLNANIEIKAVNGNVTYDEELPLAINESSNNHLKGKIGSGGVLIYVETTVGNISITKSSGRTIFS